MVKQIKPLSAYWGQIEDSRKAKGLRHPLGAVLNLCSVALMAGAKTPKGIATYWKNRQPEPELRGRDVEDARAQGDRLGRIEKGNAEGEERRRVGRGDESP